MNEKKKENLNIILKRSKDGKVKLEIGEPKYLTDEEREKRDKKYNNEQKHSPIDIATEEIKTQQRELIEGISLKFTADSIAKDLLENQQTEIVKRNLDSILRPQYFEIAESFTNQINIAQSNLSLEAIDSLLNQTNPLIDIQNTPGNQLAKYDISKLATKALVDFDNLMGEALPNQSAELELAIGDLYLEKHLTDLLGLYELKHDIEFEDDEIQPIDDTNFKRAGKEDLKKLAEMMATKHGINKLHGELSKADIEIIISKEEKYLVSKAKQGNTSKPPILSYLFIGRAFSFTLEKINRNNANKEIIKPKASQVIESIKKYYTEFDIDGIIKHPEDIEDDKLYWTCKNKSTSVIHFDKKFSDLLSNVIKRAMPNRTPNKRTLNEEDVSDLKNFIK